MKIKAMNNIYHTTVLSSSAQRTEQEVLRLQENRVPEATKSDAVCSQTSWAQTTWKEEFANLLSDPEELCTVLELSVDDQTVLRAACADFPLRVPRPYLSRIQKGNLNDPLLLQVLPQVQELNSTPGYNVDPLAEAQLSPVEGLLHKYHGRVLIVLNGNCAIHCRYCFRRHFPYQEHRIDTQHWQAILDYIRRDSSIEEVIFSGGDPLSCTNETLAKRIQSIAEIAHVTRLRIHTRLPIMIPQRITAELIALLTSTRLHCIMVIHSNHAQEIDQHVEAVLLAMHSAGILLLNQSVLLKNINDNAHTLAQLSSRLFACKTQMYYLHLLDKVQGAAHFAVSLERAKKIHKELQERVSGYLVPKLAIEEAHQKHKTLI